MADRSIVVRLRAIVGDYKSSMDQAKRSTLDLSKAVNEHTDALSRAGAVSTRAGLVMAAGLGFVTKAAIDWESAWAGVTKTVDGSAEELATLEGQLRGMAKVLPATHSEIAAVAEAAGQLGVKTKDVAGFTRVMIDLGETTNLTADEAATSLAQLMNVMGTAGRDVDRLGAAVVDLGNKGAATERDIVQMAQRIAAAGKSVGMNESAVLGFASALASVGVEAEAGGTAISQTFKDIDKAVRQGGKSLELIAKTAGMSSQEFSRAWGEDAAQAARSFIEGLGRMRDSGEDANGVLDQLGMTGIRQGDSLMRLAQAQGLLADNLDNATAAWTENTALVAEAQKRYDTTASKIAIAWNQIRDAAIDAGGTLLPLVADLAEGASTIAGAFGSLPKPIQSAAATFGLIATAGALAAGGILKAVTALSAFNAQAATLAGSATGVRLTGIGKAAGKAALGYAALATAGAGFQSWADSQRDTVTDYTLALIRLGKSGETAAGQLGASFSHLSGLSGESNGLRAALGQVAMDDWWQVGIKGIDNFGKSLIGVKGFAQQVSDEFGRMDQALTQLPADQAAVSFAKIADEARSMGVSSEQLLSIFPSLSDSYKQQAADMGLLNLSADDFVAWMSGSAPAAVKVHNTAVSSAAAYQDKYREDAEQATAALLAQAEAILGLSNSAIGFEQAIDSSTAAIKENGKGLDLNTAKGRANQSALNAMAGASLNHVDALVNSGAKQSEVNATMDRARMSYIASAVAAGMSATEASKQADKLGLVASESYKTEAGQKAARRSFMEAATAAGMGREKAEKLWRELKKIPPKVNTTVTVSTPSPKALQSLAATIHSRLQAALNANPLRVVARASNQLAVAHGGFVPRFDVGGFVPGWSPHDEADNIPAYLTADEFVVRRRSARYYGPRLHAINEGRVPREVLDAYAGGGRVGSRELAPRRLASGGPVAGAGGVGGGVSVDDLRAALSGLEVRLTGTRRFSDEWAGELSLSIARGV